MIYKLLLKSTSLFFLAVSLLFFLPAAANGAGTEWTALPSGENAGIKFGSSARARSVVYGNGKFVAVGDGGKASYSADGINWTSLTVGNDTGIKFGFNHIQEVAYGGGKFVAVGDSGMASYSSDGVNWTSLPAGQTLGIKFGSSRARTIVYGGGKFVVAGDDGKASYSFDGINWTSLPAGASTGVMFPTNASIWSLAHGGGKFVAVGDFGLASYSLDGINWTSLPAGKTTGIRFDTSGVGRSVAYGGGKFVVAGINGLASYSADGINWKSLTPGNTTGIKLGTGVDGSAMFVGYGNGKFIVLGELGKASYSFDGINWTSLPAGPDKGIKFGETAAASAAYGDGKFVAVGLFGKASYSLPLHTYINKLFREVFGQNPTAGEWQYWAERTKDKTTIESLTRTMQYHKGVSGRSPEAELVGKDLVPRLNQIIRDALGAEHLNTGMWHYYAERLTAPSNDPAHIRTASRLQEVMSYWRAVQPNNPRGLTKAEQAALQNQPPQNFVAQINSISREVFGSNPTANQWYYWADRIAKGEIINAQDLRNKMTYHSNFFQVHGRFP